MTKPSHTEQAIRKMNKEFEEGAYDVHRRDDTEIDLNSGPSVPEVVVRLAPAVARDLAENAVNSKGTPPEANEEPFA